MSMLKFFRIPFATSGDKIAVPDASQPSGSVSYTDGFGVDYELDPGVDPAAKDVPRDESNQLYFDITNAIKELQSFGTPDFITAALNGGVAFSYSKYARVLYSDGNVYVSKKNANTSLPTVAADWKLSSDNADYLSLATTAFEASVTDGKAVYWDVANTRFDEAVADGTVKQNMIGFADVTNGRVFLYGLCGLFSGLTGNLEYFLSTVTPGAITSVRPAANAVSVGVSKDGDELYVDVKLSQVLASDTIAGLVEKATDAEAQAFTADKYIDGAKLATAFKGANQSFVASGGYQKLPGGLIVQWGNSTTNAGGVSTFTFPVTFPNGYLGGTMSYVSGGLPANVTQSLGAGSVSSVVGRLSNTAGGALSGAGVAWVVYGY